MFTYRLALAVLCCQIVLHLSTPRTAVAGEFEVLIQEAHPWARFGKGAWRHVRIFTQNYDADGTATDSSIADNKTTVLEVTPDRVTLQVEVTVQVAGQRFPSQPQVIVQSFAGESLGEKVEITPLDPETISIDDRELRCETRRIVISGGVTRELCKVWFIAGQEPAVLRRQSTLSDAGGEKQLQDLTSQVMSLGMIRRILDQAAPQPVYLVRAQQKNELGTTISWSWNAPSVPGEVIEQCSHKTDAEGHIVRRTTLELVGYGIEEVPEVETNDRPFEVPSRRSRRQQRRAK